jgi:hypothetical protein
MQELNTKMLQIITVEVKLNTKMHDFNTGYLCMAAVYGGLNGVVVSVADCYLKGAGFDSRVML